MLSSVRILDVAPFASPVDERREQLGGAQILFADLAGGLAAAGHDVTIAAAIGSFVHGTTLAPLEIDSRKMRAADLGVTAGTREDDAAQARAFSLVRSYVDEHAARFDVVHAHAYDAPAFDALRHAPCPVVHTLHLPPLDARVVAAARAAAAGGAVLVTVSEANAALWRRAQVDVRRVIPNGVDIGSIPHDATHGSHLLFAGRMSPEKGVEDAIATTRRLEKSLLIVGGVYDARYFERAVRPHVTADPSWVVTQAVEGIRYVGSRTREDVLRIMARSAATLMPVRWDEPFGLVAVESLASGTPVAAYRRGGLAEIVDETCGALAEPGDLEAFAAATLRALGRSPDACRRRAERYSLGAMVARYEELMREVTGGARRSGE